MSQVTGTQLTYDIVGEREDLIDSIYNITPEETPVLSMIGRGKADAITHEWQTDVLGASDVDNAQLEGDEAAFDTPAPTKRVGNICQISRKTVNTSETLEAISKAGRRSEEAYQQAKRMAELKLDMEAIILTNQGGDLGNGATTPRRLASLGAWLQSNTDFNATDGADPTYTSGVPGAGRTDSATPRAFTKTILDTVIQSCWDNGGKPRVLFVSAANKVVVSAFQGIATHTVDVTKAAPTFILGAADVYVSNFGTVRVMASREIRSRDAYLLDPSMLSVRYLRPFNTKKLAVTGDSRRKLIVVEWTLRVNNEAGLGGAFDLT